VLISSSLFAKICEGNNSPAANTDIATAVSGTAATANLVRGRLLFHEARAALYTRPARLRVNSIVFFIGVLSIPHVLARLEAVDRVAYLSEDIDLGRRKIHGRMIKCSKKI
jgi:hypothetical protein